MSSDNPFQRQIHFNPFQHTTVLQQTTLKTYWQKHEKSPEMSVFISNLYQNSVAKGNIEQFLCLPQ